MKLLKLTPDGRCSVVEVEEFDIDKQLDQMYQLIGCSTIDIVRLPQNTGCLIVDDCGLLRDEPQLNAAATLLAGQPIVGTALLGGIRCTEYGDMITGYVGSWMIAPDPTMFDL